MQFKYKSESFHSYYLHMSTPFSERHINICAISSCEVQIVIALIAMLLLYFTTLFLFLEC